MATRVGLLSENQNPDEAPAEKVKRSVADYLVRNLLAVELGKYLFKRVKTNCARTRAIPVQVRIEPSGPAPESVRMGKLRWEPPKSKRPLKAHPWQNLIVDQRSEPAY